MDHDFWHQRWDTNQIGFHEGETNALLVAHFAALELPKDARIFLPLCGKTRDIAWLVKRGYRVAGAELSERAIRQLFDELNLPADVSDAGPLKRFSAPCIDIFVGDIFDLKANMLGPVDAVYDRAALVALPTPLRERYARHIPSITASAPQFVITFVYDQSLMDGPPFSVTGEEVHRLYNTQFDITALASKTLPGGLKGRADATEHVWLLRAR